MASAEDPFAEGCKVGTENIDFCHAVDKKFRHSSPALADEDSGRRSPPRDVTVR